MFARPLRPSGALLGTLRLATRAVGVRFFAVAEPPAPNWNEWSHRFADKMEWLNNPLLKQMPHSPPTQRLLKELVVQRDQDIREFLRTGSKDSLMPMDDHQDEFKVMYYLVQAVFNLGQQAAAAAAASKTTAGAARSNKPVSLGLTDKKGGAAEDAVLLDMEPEETTPLRMGYMLLYYGDLDGDRDYHPKYGAKVSTRKDAIPKSFCELEDDKFVFQTRAMNKDEVQPPKQTVAFADIKAVTVRRNSGKVRAQGWEHSVCFELSSGRQLKFAAKNEDDARSWCKSINSARANTVTASTASLVSFAQEFPYIVEYEWEPISAAGRGDVVFSDGGSRFAVVEVKSITFVNGSTSRAKRTTKRKHVRGQALRYARIYRHQARSMLGSHVDVTPCVYTNDDLSRMTILEEQRNNNVSFRSRHRNVCSS
eukprot:INCI9366.3.p1 GENE.INCI9366.3~~INCI9366.3.p1  ORF type:complete len:424 (-),score=74.76 INCI9366.3:370-1641(-)